MNDKTSKLKIWLDFPECNAHARDYGAFLFKVKLFILPVCISNYISEVGKEIPQCSEESAIQIFGSTTFCKYQLKHYVESFDFSNKPLLEAIREFVFFTSLPGEAQKIDRLIEMFASHWYRSNILDKQIQINPFNTVDGVFVVSFSIIMINTDLHSGKIKTNISMQDFIKMNKDVDNGQSLPEDYLKDIYSDVFNNEIIARDKFTLFSNLNFNIFKYYYNLLTKHEVDNQTRNLETLQTELSTDICIYEKIMETITYTFFQTFKYISDNYSNEVLSFLTIHDIHYHLIKSTFLVELFQCFQLITTTYKKSELINYWVYCFISKLEYHFNSRVYKDLNSCSFIYLRLLMYIFNNCEIGEYSASAIILFFLNIFINDGFHINYSHVIDIIEDMESHKLQSEFSYKSSDANLYSINQLKSLLLLRNNDYKINQKDINEVITNNLFLNETVQQTEPNSNSLASKWVSFLWNNHTESEKTENKYKNNIIKIENVTNFINSLPLLSDFFSKITTFSAHSKISLLSILNQFNTEKNILKDMFIKNMLHDEKKGYEEHLHNLKILIKKIVFIIKVYNHLTEYGYTNALRENVKEMIEVLCLFAEYYFMLDNDSNIKCSIVLLFYILSKSIFSILQTKLNNKSSLNTEIQWIFISFSFLQCIKNISIKQAIIKAVLPLFTSLLTSLLIDEDIKLEKYDISNCLDLYTNMERIYIQKNKYVSELNSLVWNIFTLYPYKLLNCCKQYASETSSNMLFIVHSKNQGIEYVFLLQLINMLFIPDVNFNLPSMFPLIEVYLTTLLSLFFDPVQLERKSLESCMSFYLPVFIEKY